MSFAKHNTRYKLGWSTVAGTLLGLLLSSLSPGQIGNQIITTVVGTEWVYPARTLPALGAPLGEVQDVALDSSGRLYLADQSNSHVLRVGADGKAVVIAGNGQAEFSGEGGQAINASMDPCGIAVDGANNVYIADQGNHRIRKLLPSGVIVTIAGNGHQGGGSGFGKALDVPLSAPEAVAVDPKSGVVYIADTGNSRILRLATDGTISTLADRSDLSYPKGVALGPDGFVYIADSFNNRVVKVGPDKRVVPVAGSGSPGFCGDNDLATNACIDTPLGVAVDASGAVFVADGNNRIRKIVGNMITTVAGNGNPSFSGDGADPVKAGLSMPSGLAVDASGSIFIADLDNHRVRQISSGRISTVAGSGEYHYGGDGGAARAAFLNHPTGAVIDHQGNILVADHDNNRIRRIARDGTITTVAGDGRATYSGDGGLAVSASLSGPIGVAVDSHDDILIADSGNNRIRKVSGGKISTVAGNGTPGYSGDGDLAPRAAIQNPWGICVDKFDAIYFADHDNNRIRKVVGGVISTIAGGAGSNSTDNGISAAAAGLEGPQSVAVDSAGNLYLTDVNHHLVRKIGPDGKISTVPVPGVESVTVGLRGEVYLTKTIDYSGPGPLAGFSVWRLDASGSLFQFAGNGHSDYYGDGGLATKAALNQPNATAVDALGNVLIVDTYNDRIRLVEAQSDVSYQVSLCPDGASSASQGAPCPAALQFTATAGAALPSAQSIWLSSVVSGLAYSVTSDQPWLKVSPPNGVMGAQLRVAIDTTGLTPKTYSGHVMVSVPYGTPTTKTVDVSLELLKPPPGPALSVDLPALTFSAPEGTGPSRQTFSVSNSGGGTLDFRVELQTGSGWLSVSTERGSLTPAAPAKIVVTATPGSLAAGTYRGGITVTGVNTGETANLEVTLSISGTGAVVLASQNGLAFNVVQRGGTAVPQQLGILNTGTGPMDFTVSTSTVPSKTDSGPPWLYLVGKDSNGNDVNVRELPGRVERPYLDVFDLAVTVDATGLSVGKHYGRVQVFAAAVNSPWLITVVVDVQPAESTPSPSVATPTILFTGVAGSNPESKDIVIANLAGKADNFTLSQNPDGFKVVQTDGVLSATEPTHVVVYPDFSKLSPGEVRQGTVTIQFRDGSQQTIDVISVAAATPGAAPVLVGDRVRLLPRDVGPLRVYPTSLRDGFSVAAGLPTLVEVSVTENSQTPLISFSSPQGGCETMTRSSTAIAGVWQCTWLPRVTPTGKVRIQVDVFGLVLTETPPRLQLDGTIKLPGTTPTVKAGARNSANYESAPIAPGSLISLFGTNLSNHTMDSAVPPFPLAEDGVQAFLGTIPLPLLYVDPQQLNVQVPYNIPKNTKLQLSVQRDEELSVPVSLVVSGAQPGVFTQNDSGTGQGVIYHADDLTLASPAMPAVVGETVHIFGSGLGEVTPAVAEGMPAPSNPVAKTVAIPTVRIGGVAATLVESKSILAPGTAGLYKIFAIVPEGSAIGDSVPVTIEVAGQQSLPATMAVRR